MRPENKIEIEATMKNKKINKKIKKIVERVGTVLAT